VGRGFWRCWWAQWLAAAGAAAVDQQVVLVMQQDRGGVWPESFFFE